MKIGIFLFYNIICFLFVLCPRAIAKNMDHSMQKIAKKSIKKNFSKQKQISLFFDKSQSYVRLKNGTKIIRKYDRDGIITSISLDQNNDQRFDFIIYYSNKNNEQIITDYKIDSNFDQAWDIEYSCKKNKNQLICVHSIDLDFDKKMDFSYNENTGTSTVLNQKLYEKLIRNKEANDKIAAIKKPDPRSPASLPQFEEAGLPSSLLNGCTDEECIKNQSSSLIEAMEIWEQMLEGSYYYKNINGDTEPKSEQQFKLNQKYADFRRTKFDVLIHKNCETKAIQDSFGKDYIFNKVFDSYDQLSKFVVSSTYDLGSDTSKNKKMAQHLPKLIKMMGSNHPDQMPKIVCGDAIENTKFGNKQFERVLNCNSVGSAILSQSNFTPITETCKLNENQNCSKVSGPAVLLNLNPEKCDGNQDLVTKSITNTIIHEFFHTMNYIGLNVATFNKVPKIEYAYACAHSIVPGALKLDSNKSAEFYKMAKKHCARNDSDLIDKSDEVRCEIFNLCEHKQTHSNTQSCEQVLANPNSCKKI